MKKGFLVLALMVTVLLSALPAAGQDAVKAEIRQAIDAAYLNAIFNGKDIKAFLNGWDHGAIIPHVIPAIGGRVDAVTGNVTYIGVMEAHAAEANRKPPEKKEFTFLYPVVDVTGNVGMAQVEIMRGEKILRTVASSRSSRPGPGGSSWESLSTGMKTAPVRKPRPARPMGSRRWSKTRSCAD